jgi:hypothetical protein
MPGAAPGGQLVGAAAGPPGGDPTDVMAEFGEDDRGKRITLPDNYQPVRVGVISLEPSKNKRTPELRLLVQVVDGPFAGYEVSRRDSSLWMTLANPMDQRADQNVLPGRIGSKLGLWNHMTKALTGMHCDSNALATFGIQLSGDPGRRGLEIAAQFHSLDENAKCQFIGQLCRIEAWNGREAICYIQLSTEDATDAQGVVQMDAATGQPRKRNRNQIGNFYGLDDVRYGRAVWERAYAPQLVEQANAMRAQGML